MPLIITSVQWPTLWPNLIRNNNISMKIIICDVGDAACAFVSSANRKTMMIDCGCQLYLSLVEARD